MTVKPFCFVENVVYKVKQATWMSCKYGVPEYPVVYAADILLVSPSVSSLQCILRISEAELEWLDMRVNPNRSACVRFGARYSIKCRNISTSDNFKLVWSDNVRY